MHRLFRRKTQRHQSAVFVLRLTSRDLYTQSTSQPCSKAPSGTANVCGEYWFTIGTRTQICYHSMMLQPVAGSASLKGAARSI